MRLESGKKQTAWLAENGQTVPATKPDLKSSSMLPLAPGEVKTTKPAVSSVKNAGDAKFAARHSRTNYDLSTELFAPVSSKNVALSTIQEALQFSLPESTLERLVQSERFGKRLGSLIEEYHQPEAFDPSRVDIDDLRVALTVLDQFDRTSLIAGAMWNGEALRTTLQKVDIREMMDLLGRETLAFAIMNALQPPSQAPSPKPLEAIRSDGVACFHAWAVSIPRCLKQRIELRQPSLFHQVPEPSDMFLASGPLIVRKVAQHIMGLRDE